MKKYIIVAFCFLGGLIFDVTAVEDSLRKKVDPASLQEAPELKKKEVVLEQGIQKLNQDIAYYQKLRDIEIRLTPGKTIFRKNSDENYIEIESYSFIPESYIYTNLVGLRYKEMRLYFGQGGVANKLETNIIEQNFLTHERRETRITDPSPTTEDMSDIVITSQLNVAPQEQLTIGKMENTISRPLRIRFKKSYIKHLINFEKLLRLTEDFQIKYAVDTEKKVLLNLKESLKY